MGRIDAYKPKTAWDVVSRRHGLVGRTSYETFKRFYRAQILSGLPAHSVPRIETEPGEETQIDYGQAGHKLVDMYFHHGNTALIAPGNPIKPSKATISTSCTPRFLSSFKTPSQNFVPLFCSAQRLPDDRRPESYRVLLQFSPS